MAVRVLYVDDDPLWLGLLREMLREILGPDTRIATAVTGDQALRLLKRYPFELMITDLGLRDMPGLELIAQARLVRPETEVVVLSGTTDPAAVAQACACGATRFVAKPITMTCLLDVIGQARTAPTASGCAVLASSTAQG